MVRLNLYNKDLFCGDQAIHWKLEDLGVKPLPSLRTIIRILSRNELTQLHVVEDVAWERGTSATIQA